MGEGALARADTRVCMRVHTGGARSAGRAHRERAEGIGADVAQPPDEVIDLPLGVELAFLWLESFFEKLSEEGSKQRRLVSFDGVVTLNQMGRMYLDHRVHENLIFQMQREKRPKW